MHRAALPTALLAFLAGLAVGAAVFRDAPPTEPAPAATAGPAAHQLPAPAPSRAPSLAAPAPRSVVLSDDPDLRQQQLWARRQQRLTRDALARLATVAEHHDFTDAEHNELDELLAAERDSVIRILEDARARGDVAAGLAAVEDLREDTDDQAAEILSGTRLKAFKLMRDADKDRRLE